MKRWGGFSPWGADGSSVGMGIGVGIGIGILGLGSRRVGGGLGWDERGFRKPFSGLVTTTGKLNVRKRVKKGILYFCIYAVLQLINT